MKPPSISQNITPRALDNSCHSGSAPRVLIASDVIIPSSPNVKNVTNDSGFIPVRYALRYGMYIVPHKIPAPNAAHTPLNECAAGPCPEDAIASTPAPTHITNAPPTTPAQRRQPACCNSLKKRNPHKMPSRLFEFHNGNAMLSPISRIA